jgi:hypothetical protein
MIIIAVLDDIDNKLLSIKYLKKAHELKIFTIYELNLKLTMKYFMKNNYWKTRKIFFYIKYYAK